MPLPRYESFFPRLELYCNVYVYTSFVFSWADPSTGLSHVAASFDQEAAAVVMGRMAIARSQDDGGPDVLRWLDRMLIRLVGLVSGDDIRGVFNLILLFSVKSLVNFLRTRRTRSGSRRISRYTHRYCDTL